MLNVHQVRLRFIFARASYLRRLFQKAYERGIYCVTAHKLILNVSIPPWMAVVPRRNEICVAQISQVKNVHGCTFFTVPAVLFYLIPCICIVYFKRLTKGASTALLRTN